MRTPAEKEKIKEGISKKIEATKRSIESLKEQSKPVAPDSAIGRITRMDAIGQKSVAEANLRNAEETLIKLEEALVKIEDPDFGLCERCKQPIPIERILALPETKTCVHCVGRLF